VTDLAQPRLAAVALGGPRVIGLDLSLTSTGLADSAGAWLRTSTIASNSPGPNAQLTEHRRRLRGIVHEITDHISSQGAYPTLVVIEGPSYGSKGAGTWDRGGLWWLVVDYLLGGLERHRHPIAVVPPAALKKYATGRGNADKTAMAVALQRRMHIELGDDNQTDAWWLCAAGLDHLGHPVVDMPKDHRAALSKVAWPAEVPTP
jgi:Holliday junction resolvasome RuvABC endonuclease subunit